MLYTLYTLEGATASRHTPNVSSREPYEGGTRGATYLNQRQVRSKGINATLSLLSLLSLRLLPVSLLPFSLQQLLMLSRHSHPLYLGSTSCFLLQFSHTSARGCTGYLLEDLLDGGVQRSVEDSRQESSSLFLRHAGFLHRLSLLYCLPHLHQCLGLGLNLFLQLFPKLRQCRLLRPGVRLS